VITDRTLFQLLINLRSVLSSGGDFTILAVAALGLLSAVPALAQDAAAVTHVLKATLFDGGLVKIGGLPKAGLYVFTKPVSFSCTAVCTLEVDIMEQVGDNTTPKNLWDVCADLDGKTTEFFCPYQGTLPTDKSFVVGNFIWTVPVKAGAHTAEPLVFVSGAAFINSFQIAYRIYQP
jgi:hypothetical protein